MVWINHAQQLGVNLPEELGHNPFCHPSCPCGVPQRIVLGADWNTVCVLLSRKLVEYWSDHKLCVACQTGIHHNHCRQQS